MVVFLYFDIRIVGIKTNVWYIIKNKYWEEKLYATKSKRF